MTGKETSPEAQILVILIKPNHCGMNVNHSCQLPSDDLKLFYHLLASFVDHLRRQQGRGPPVSEFVSRHSEPHVLGSRADISRPDHDV